MARRLGLFVLALVLSHAAFAIEQLPVKSPAVFVRGLLDAPASQDFARAKLAIDKFVDPSVDVEAALAEIDGMVAIVEKMLATLPPGAASTSAEKFRAIQAFLYQGGHWNDEKPFQYDRSDPYGQNIALALLPNYLASRNGNCVSMPMLVLILGERLGLDVTLSTAPLHVFVKFTDDASGQTWNFEATSGGFARDSHMRQEMPMSDQAIANGVYMKALSRREALAVMASTNHGPPEPDRPPRRGGRRSGRAAGSLSGLRLCAGEEGHGVPPPARPALHPKIPERARHPAR